MSVCGLTKEKCGPCHGEGQALTIEETKELMGALKGWNFAQSGAAIHKRFEFKDFVSAIAFVNKIGELAEGEGHHPDLGLGWGYADVTLTTHFFSALSRNDFIVAAKIDALQG